MPMLSLRVTLRQLRRDPAYIAAVVFSLAIGMAVCAAVFSILNVFLFAPVPGVLDRSTVIHIRWMGGPELLTPAEFGVVERELAPVMEGVLAQGERGLPIALPSETVTSTVAFVSNRLFETLGTSPTVGRLLNQGDAAPGAAPVAVIGDTLWRRYFGADPGAMGRSIAIGGRSFGIVGVSPSGFSGLRLALGDQALDGDGAPQVWVPLTSASPNVPWLSVGGRLAGDADPNAFKARLAVAAAHAARESPIRHEPAALRSFRAGLNWRSDPWDALMALGLALIVPLSILAIGCANVVNLQLARATERARELSVRLTLGASRPQLLRLLGIEIVILSCVAGGAGWIGARLLLRAAQPLFPVQLTLDWNVWWLLLILVTMVIAAAGLAPALLALRNVIAIGARQGGDSLPHQRLRSALVVVQVAVSVVLLFVSGLGLRALQSTYTQLPPRADQILSAEFDLSQIRQPAPDPGAFIQGILARLRDQGPTPAAAFSTFLRYGRPVRLWLPQDGDGIGRTVYAGEVTSGWFDVMDLRLLAGRGFNDAGLLTDVVVNEALASQLTDRSALLGTRLRLKTADGSIQAREVVGVVQDQRGSNLPMAFLPMPAALPSSLVLVVRSTDPATALPIVRHAIQAAEPLAPVDTIRSLADRLDDPFGDLRGIVIVGVMLGTLALVLAAAGEYAVLAFSVRRRTREIGIRVAVGANRWSILRLVVHQALSVTVIGLMLGFALGLPLTVVMRAAFLGISPMDPLTMAIVATGMLFVALAASLLPALRAMRVGPAVALRDE
jgi:predicted permease